MATEALVTDQTAEGHREEVKDATRVKPEAAVVSEEKQEAAEGAKSGALADSFIRKEGTSKPEAETNPSAALELKDRADVTDIPESPKQSNNDSGATLVQASESEAAKVSVESSNEASAAATTEPAIEEVNASAAEELPQVSSVSVADKEAEGTIVSPVTEKPKSLEDENAVVTEPSPAKELKGEEEGAAVTEDVDEKKDASLGGDKTALVEEGKDDINTESGKAEKGNEETLTETAKGTGEAPRIAGSAKCSHCQSNNIFSKVKHSIVKVKKAIIGKSPSSKAMSAEGKHEIKAK
ncbi:uncharacterized protein LOC109843543 [Asparagus officinalis]|uniref:uncharacterized protein LOC109843543 n=1 Tax=Asparagus officinalis TaxID=4686 RepID=UPI00098E04C6|nr:uncharacterized protein LOC109843543 [Asparagus officinalis]